MMYNDEQKNRYLNNCKYEEPTIEIIKVLFNRITKVEEAYDKDVSKFTETEIINLLTSFHAKSRSYLKVLCVHLSNYFKWCVLEGLVTDVDNKYDASFTTSIIERIIPTESLIKKERVITEFSKINSSEGLISYLTDSYRRLENKKNKPCYLYHYTKLSTVVNIIKSRLWYIGNPKNMNDGLEYYHADQEKWNKIFFASFMTESKESLAMWSMYAQPWEDGVMITIPSNEFKSWIRNTDKIYKADPETKITDKNSYVKSGMSKLYISNVAYSNTDSKMENETEIITCGSAQNEILRNVVQDTKLVGFVKNEAWAYEKEVRLRVDLEDNVNFEGVSIEVPDYIINSMIITKGPRFIGDLSNRLAEEIDNVIKAKESLFFGKFRYIPCDQCGKRKLV